MEDFDISSLPEIASMRIMPYRKNQRCPKCGNRERRSWFWLAVGRINMLGRSYCLGGGPPTVDITVDGKTQTVPTICAGTRREHVHLHCPICQYNFMCEVADA